MLLVGVRVHDHWWPLVLTYKATQPVLPDVEIKSCPIFPKCAQKVANAVYLYKKLSVFKIAQKPKNIWA